MLITFPSLFAESLNLFKWRDLGALKKQGGLKTLPKVTKETWHCRKICAQIFVTSLTSSLYIRNLENFKMLKHKDWNKSFKQPI